MGLITSEAEVVLNGANMKRYENLGYIIPKVRTKWGKLSTPNGTTIMVKISDLSKGSNAKVKVQCDCCGEILEDVLWETYCKTVKEDGSYYCIRCVKTLFTTEKMLETKLKKGKSFEEYCLENNRQDILDRWDYELNSTTPNKVLFKSRNKFWFKCSEHSEHKSELKSIADFSDGHEKTMGCEQCNSFAQYLLDRYGENALNQFWNYEKNKNINPWEIPKNYNKKVWVKCQEKDYHGSYETICGDFVGGSRCPYCCNFHGKVHIYDSLGYLFSEVIKIWSDKNKKSPYEYTPMTEKEVWWKCPEGRHEDYKRSINSSNKSSFRCPHCVEERKESLLQEKVRLYLESLGYTVLHEFRCTICPKNILIPPMGVKGERRKTQRLRYDNEIVIDNNKHLIIECHGKQHYEENNLYTKLNAKKHGTTQKREFEYSQERDEYKEKYAKEQGYEYLIIPYWDIDNIETIINNKIESII